LVPNDSKAQRPATNREKESEKKGQEEDGKRKVQFLYGVLALMAATVVSVDVKDFLESRSKPKQNVLLDHAFAKCQVTEIKQINHDTRLYKIRAKNDGEAAMPIPYHILIKDDSCQVARSYSPVTISDNFELGLVIKHYKDGIMSSMLDQVKLGESILVSGPICSMLVPYKENSVAELGMIAGGTGITPMYQLLKKILQSKTDKTKITLYYINKTPQDILLKKELDHFATNFPDRFKLVYALDSIQKKEDVLNYSLGRPTQESLQSILPSPSTSSCILICGPDG
jgi:cytochrome-b5 reductase